MGKKLLVIALTLFSFYSFAQTRPGSLRGTVTDATTGETIPFANVVIKNTSGNIITGGATDLDGQYNINPVTPGIYNVEVSFAGFRTYILTGIEISPNVATIQDFKLNEEAEGLEEVVVTYQAPMIDKNKTSTTIGQESIQEMAVRDIGSIAAQAPGVTQDANGNINIRGARSEGTVQYVDGVKMRGSANIPQAAIQQTEIITGGLPAQYGDAVGGVINTTTRGPSSEYFGSVELVSSVPVELLSKDFFGDYGYNLAALTAGGPLIKNKKSGLPIVGFLLATELSYVKEGRPGIIPYVHLNEDVLADLQANPIAMHPSGQSVIYRSELVTEDDLSDIDYQQNSASKNIRVNGNIQIVTGRNTNLFVGGFWNYGDSKANNYGSHIFNYDNNLTNRSMEWSSYVRFQQKFGGEADDDARSLINNAFYTIQVDYTRNTTKIFDERYEDDFFRYGHIGKFTVHETPMYVQGTDTVLNIIGYRYVGNAPVGVDFEQGPYNTVRGNYTRRYFELAEENPGLNTLTIPEIRGAGIPVNGSNPRALYNGLWTSPGTGLSTGALGVNANYYKDRQSQFRVTASTSFDIDDHSLIVGFEYEQRIDRAYALNANALWQRLEHFQNFAITQLDISNPQPVYVDGVRQDTINYPRLFSEDAVSEVDRNIRIALGLDPRGQDIINIHELDPDLLSIDMFSADELVNPGGVRYVGYYGYDYVGNIVEGQPTLDDFFTERDERGNLTRPIGAFRPIYMAGYIQDQFTFNDLTFNVGVRIDRLDLNQQVLKDPYVLYPTYTVRDLSSTELNPAAYEGGIPGGIGQDFVVYLSSFDYSSAGTNIVGYRDPEGNQWYNAQGQPITDPLELAQAAGGGIKPFLVNPNVAADTSGTGALTSASFRDYEPQTVVMPRIAFNFPITDEALFIAHYDVLAQRPTTGLSRMDPFDYLNLDSKRSGGVLNNPDLRPQKTTEYELGFKQTLTDNTALKISAFYREMRDLIQSQAFTQAYPITYVAYGNLDFGTVKGFTVEYEMRRTNNIKLDANYTLMFADGTGSSATSGLNLAQAGQPNLRYILPLTFDNRHSILARFDYRYGSGAAYNGPVWWNSRVFESTGLNITMNAISGQPFTRRNAPYALTNPNPSSISQVEGQINGSRLPWQVTFDARINKVFNVSKENKDLSMEVYLVVYNVLDHKNVVNVYPYTGSAEDDAYLASPAAQTLILEQTNTQSYVDLYNRRMLSPFNYALPRRVRLGVVFNF